MSAVVGVTATLVLVSGKPGMLPQANTPALKTTNESLLSAAGVTVQCDSDHHCDGGACCWNFDTGHWSCSPSLWATCWMHEDNSCWDKYPINCNRHCCHYDDVCRLGSGTPGHQCYARSTTGDDHVYAQNGTADFVNSKFTSGTPPLGWIPDISSFNAGMTKTASEGLHDSLLAVQAHAWRTDPRGGNGAGQCYVVGFPENLAHCNSPWDAGCKGNKATIAQDGEMTIYNQDPISAPVGEQMFEWCNDDYNEEQQQSATYSFTETQTISITQSATTKITDSDTSATELDANFVIAKGKETFTFAFTMELDVSLSSTQTKTQSRTWEQSVTVNVGPRSRSTTTCFLSQGKLDSPYDAKVKLNTPIVWACTCMEQANDPSCRLWPEDESLWQSSNLEQHMKSVFGFEQKDLDVIFSAKTGGNLKAIMGQKVSCSTHTEKLQDGESCSSTRGLMSNTTVLV